MTTRSTVAIVGAGPTGLLLAGDLAQAGVDVTVLEQRGTESNLTRAFGVHARTLEHLDARGLADEILAKGAHVEHLDLFDKLHLDLAPLPTRFPFLLITPQYNVEQALQRRALAAGARIIRDAKVTTLKQDADGVDVIYGASTLRADYVVGSDGVNSTVRAALGLPFPGESVLTSIMLADVRLANPPEDVLLVNAVGDAFAFVAPFGDGWHRVFAWNRAHQMDDDDPLTLDEIREVTRRSFGRDLGIAEARWMSRFHSDERQVPNYRVGRVFLAGDAAHVHSPAGGQGMNTGLQDAVNLGWKLAAHVQGWAPEGLLDSYEAERKPVGRVVLRSSGAIIRMAMVRSPLGKWLRNTIGGALLHIPAFAHRVTGIVSGIGIDYRGAPRTGDVALADGSRLYELLRQGRYVLVSSDDAARIGDHVVRAAPAEPSNTALLVRPDGHVAWRGPVTHVPAALERAGLTHEGVLR